jgi:SSS family solute:Na+ symporter
MLLGCATAIGFMIRDGLAANTPIYASLAVSAVSFIIVSLMGQAAAPVHGDSSSRSTP